MKILEKKTLNIFACFLIVLGIISSLYILNLRINVEKEYKGLEVLVNTTELESLANANDLTEKELAEKLGEKGITGVLVKELSLGDLNRWGKIQYYLGQEIQLTPFASSLPENLELNDSSVAIAILEKDLEEQVIRHLEAKVKGLKVYQGDISVLTVPINIPSSEDERVFAYEKLNALGVGFYQNELAEISSLGLSIAPQIRSWPKTTPESLEFVAEEIRNIPNLSVLMFNDGKLPGYPDQLKNFAELLKDEQGKALAPIGTIEFFNQKGINQLANSLNKEAVRMHSVTFGEMLTKTPKEVMDRLILAVEERNIRVLFVRFFDMETPATALDKNLAFVGDLTKNLENKGYQLGGLKDFNSLVYYNVLILIIGLGVLGGVMLLFLKDGQKKLALLLGFLGLVFWLALFWKNPILARKTMALLGVVVFPILAFQRVIRKEKRDFKQSLVAFFQLNALSFIGAIFLVGLLSDKIFMLKLDQFSGVKLAHILPLIFIPIFVYGFKFENMKRLKDFLEKAITYKIALLAGAAALVLGFYIIRTGNVGANLVSGLESSMRQGLQDLFGVRPRTKEFLIGQPFLLLLLYYGLNKKNWPLLFVAAIGQISLVNTYAHIHTPFLVSLLRSFHGLWLGLVLGILLLIVVKQGLAFLQKKWGHLLCQK